MVLSLTVFAQRPGGRSGGQGQHRGAKPDATKILAQLDTNNDNKIDVREASKDKRGKISEHFERIDANGDEFIDLEELKASLNNRRSEKKPKKVSADKLIKAIDDNGDGTLNELEVAAKNDKRLIENFKWIDTNNDKELDVAELKAFLLKDNKKSRREKH